MLLCCFQPDCSTDCVYSHIIHIYTYHTAATTRKQIFKPNVMQHTIYFLGGLWWEGGLNPHSTLLAVMHHQLPSLHFADGSITQMHHGWKVQQTSLKVVQQICRTM